MNDENSNYIDQSAFDDTVSELQQSIVELKEAIRARDEFISVAAHELRNPMTPILGQVELLLLTARQFDGKLPPQITTGLESLQRLIETYIDRATVLLDVNRIASGMLHLRSVTLDFSDIVTRVVERYQRQAARMECDLTTAIEPGVVGPGDPLAVEQIVGNLVSNAVKYGAGGPILVALADLRECIQLVVQDHGPGIATADQERIFARFERVVAARDHGGFGIGLWIVRQLVEVMGGKITVDSTPGRGSSFTIVLPKARRSHQER